MSAGLTPRVREWGQGGRGERFRERRIHVFQREGSGIPLVLLHGFPSSSFDWRGVLDVADAHPALAFDFLGFGLSEKPREHTYTLGWQADLTEDLVQRHLGGGPVFVVAHDMGTSVATELLARDLDGTLGIQIAGALLFNGSIVLERATLTRGQKLLRGPLGPLASVLTNERMFRREFGALFSPAHPLSDAEAADQWALIAHGGGRTLGHKLIHYLDERVRYADRWHGAMQRLGPARCPSHGGSTTRWRPSRCSTRSSSCGRRLRSTVLRSSATTRRSRTRRPSPPPSGTPLPAPGWPPDARIRGPGAAPQHPAGDHRPAALPPPLAAGSGLARGADAERGRARPHRPHLHERLLQHGDVLAEPRDAAHRALSRGARSHPDAHGGRPESGPAQRPGRHRDDGQDPAPPGGSREAGPAPVRARRAAPRAALRRRDGAAGRDEQPRHHASRGRVRGGLQGQVAPHPPVRGRRPPQRLARARRGSNRR